MIAARSLLALNARPGTFQKFPSILCRNVTLKSVPPPTLSASETHDDKNKRLGRPMSPHLQIYQLQLTSLLSVSHRATGIILTSYAAGFAYLSFTSGDVKSTVALIQSIGVPSPILFVFKAGLAFPFTFHLLNGVRHLVWDMGRALTIKGVYSTGYTVVASSAVLALILAFL